MDGCRPAEAEEANENANCLSSTSLKDGEEVDDLEQGQEAKDDVEAGGELGGERGGRGEGDEETDEAAMEVSSGRACCHKCDFTAREFLGEIKVILKLAWPNVVYMLLEAMMTILAVLFSGHLGKNELAAASLANSITTVFTRSIGLGFASSCDTLFSQLYGSPNRHHIGVVLQRGFIIMSLLCFVCWGILINAETILLLAQQNSEVARLAGVYCLIYIPAVPADYYSMLLIKYLQCQSTLMPVVITTFITNLISIVIYYVLIYPCKLGLVGAVIAQVLSHYILSLLITIYIFWKKLYKDTWTGWTKACLDDWSPIVRLGMAGCLMVCLEWWSFDMGFYLAGLLGEEQIGAHAVIMYTATTGYMFPYGIGIAAAIRVGNSLGGRRPRTAYIASMASLSLGVVSATILAVIYSSMKDVIPYLFTSDQKIVNLASTILPVCALFSVLDATATVCGGIIRGTGRQAIGAAVNLLGYYLIGLPIAISLMFAVGKGVHGFWSGMTLGLLTHALFFVIFIFKLDWRRETKKAQKRIGLEKTELSNGNAPPLKVGYDSQSEEESSKASCSRDPTLARHRLDSDALSSSNLSSPVHNNNETDGTPRTCEIGSQMVPSKNGYLLVSSVESSPSKVSAYGTDVNGSDSRALSSAVVKAAEGREEGYVPANFGRLVRRCLCLFIMGSAYVALAAVCRQLTVPLLRVLALNREQLYANETSTSIPTSPAVFDGGDAHTSLFL
ncbi:multidrug and toxin extrusion protein 1-like [Diadema antillarum]|uniref:multidrug and toxin extrusion protein 1-like n=1 Tax=Diadema antillarum TaxID=105358 RepID=UPI003A8C2F65